MTVSKVAALPAERTFHITGFALTDSGEIFASFHDAANPKAVVSGLFHLERGSAGGRYKWVAVPGTLGVYLKDSPIHQLWGAVGRRWRQTGFQPIERRKAVLDEVKEDISSPAFLNILKNASPAGNELSNSFLPAFGENSCFRLGRPVQAGPRTSGCEERSERG